MRISKKILAIALSILMAVSMMPFTVFAATTIDVATAADLKTAVANADSGDTIRFTASFAHTAKQVGFQVDKDLTFDLNGQTITGPANGTTKTTDGDTLNKTEVMWVTGSANVTFKDSVGGGSWTYTYSANSAAYFVDARDNSVITVESGTYTSSNANYGGYVFYLRGNASLVVNGGTIEATGSSKRDSCVFSNTSTTSVEVNGGTFNTGKNADYTVSNSGTTEINDGTFNGTVSGTAGKTVINGGEFKKADSTTVQDVSKYTATDKVQNQNGEVVDVQASTVAKIGNTEYSSIDDALADAASGATIILVKDIAGPVVISKDVTIDGAGNTISASTQTIVITTAAKNVTIKNADIEATASDETGRAIWIGNTNNYNSTTDTKITFSNCNIETTQRGIYFNGDYNSNVTLNVTSSTISLTNGITNYDEQVDATSNYQNSRGIAVWDLANSKLNITSSTIQGFYYAVNVTGDENGNDGLVVTAKNSTFKGRDALNIHSANTTNNVTGCNIHGINTASGSQEKFGCIVVYEEAANTVINIKDTTFTAYMSAAAQAAETSNEAMLDIRNNSTTVNVTGNSSYITEYSAENTPVVNNFTGEENADSGVTIESGVYTDSFSDYAPEGYESIYDATAGGYVIAEDTHTVAKIGNAKYDSLQDAIDAASSNDTITLVADVNLATDETINIYSKGNIEIDLNGHDITGDVHTSYSSNYVGMVNIANSTVVIGDSSANPGTIANESTGYYATAAIVVGAAKTSAVSGITGASSLTINDGVNVVCNNVYGQTVDGRMRKNLCNGIAVRAANGAATLVVNDANITTNGVGINCQSASEQTPVTVTVNGGSITCTNTGSANARCLQTNTYDESYNMSITGGNFSAQAASVLGTNYKYEESISGGVFSNDVSDYVIGGYETVYDETAGGYVLAEDEPDNGSSLTLSDKIETTIYIDAHAYGVDASEAVVKATYNHNAADTTPSVSTDTIALSELDQYVSGDQYNRTYMFKYACAPAQITEDCTIELYATANAETPVYTETYSAKDYCDKVNALYDETQNPSDEFTELDALCDAIVDYAKAAQIKFNYNKDLTDAYRDARVQTLSASQMVVEAENDKNGVLGFAFDCQDELNILAYTDGEAAPSNVSIAATLFNDKISAAADSKEGYNFVRVKGIGSGNLSKVITFDVNGNTVTVSAAAIAKAYVESTSENVNSDMKDLARAIYLYGQAANAYFYHQA